MTPLQLNTDENRRDYIMELTKSLRNELSGM